MHRTRGKEDQVIHAGLFEVTARKVRCRAFESTHRILIGLQVFQACDSAFHSLKLNLPLVQVCLIRIPTNCNFERERENVINKRTR